MESRLPSWRLTQKPKPKKRRKKTRTMRTLWTKRINTPAFGCLLDNGEAKALTEPKWEISEAVWHPSGTGLMLTATDHPESDQNTERIFFFRLWDAASGTRKEVNTMTQVLAPRGPFSNIRIAQDGIRMAFVGCREDGPTPHDLILARHGEKGVQNLSG